MGGGGGGGRARPMWGRGCYQEGECCYSSRGITSLFGCGCEAHCADGQGGYPAGPGGFPTGGQYGGQYGMPYGPVSPEGIPLQPAPDAMSAGQVAYPYYTNRGPRDFLLRNPPSIGP